MTITVGYSGEENRPVAIGSNAGNTYLTIGAAKTIATSLLLIIEHLESTQEEEDETG